MVGTYFVIRDCALKKQQPFSYGMIRYALLTPLYWVFMSMAAYKALFQLIVKPFYWEKTIHGLDCAPQEKDRKTAVPKMSAAIPEGAAK